MGCGSSSEQAKDAGAKPGPEPAAAGAAYVAETKPAAEAEASEAATAAGAAAEKPDGLEKQDGPTFMTDTETAVSVEDLIVELDALYKKVGDDVDEAGAALQGRLVAELEKAPELIERLKKAQKPVGYILQYYEEDAEDRISLEEFKEQMLSEDSLEALFVKCDLDGDGWVTKSEIVTALECSSLQEKLVKAGKPIRYIIKYFSEDLEKDQRVDLEHFRTMLHAPSLEAVFVHCDIDGDGKVTVDELEFASHNMPELEEAFLKAGKPLQVLMDHLRTSDSKSIELADFRELLHNGAPATAEAA